MDWEIILIQTKRNPGVDDPNDPDLLRQGRRRQNNHNSQPRHRPRQAWGTNCCAGCRFRSAQSRSSFRPRKQNCFHSPRSACRNMTIGASPCETQAGTQVGPIGRWEAANTRVADAKRHEGNCVLDRGPIRLRPDRLPGRHLRRLAKCTSGRA